VGNMKAQRYRVFGGQYEETVIQGVWGQYEGTAIQGVWGQYEGT